MPSIDTEADGPIRVLIADDHGVLRAGLRALLGGEEDFEVIGEAVDGQETLEKAADLQPDVILLDVSMPDLGGLEVARRLKRSLPQTHILILTVHEDDRLLQEAIDVGAAGYITKRAIESELINAIRSVRRGDLYVHPTMTRALLREEKPQERYEGEELIEPLTPRETDVLRLIAQGYTNRQSAEILGISVRTVETHRANLMDKLNIHHRAELVRYAREHGLFD